MLKKKNDGAGLWEEQLTVPAKVIYAHTTHVSETENYFTHTIFPQIMH